MGVSLLLTGLVFWLKARDPDRLGSRVTPWKVAPTREAPYLTYKVLANKPSYYQKGRSGIATAMVRLEIWSKDHAEAWGVAGRIAGTKAEEGTANQGFAGFRGLMGDAEKVFIQAAFQEDGGDVYDPNAAGAEDGWYQVIQDYRITYETEPRG